MIWEELKADTRLVAQALERRLKYKYPFQVMKCRPVFKNDHKVCFALFTYGFGGAGSYLGIEYRDIMKDGDRFYPADYSSLDELLDDMVKEIESETEHYEEVTRNVI